VKVSCHVCSSNRIVQYRKENNHQILSCRDCHLLFLESNESGFNKVNDNKNQDSDSEFQEDYWGEITRQSEENNARYLATHKYFVNRIIGLFPEKTPINLIDLGSGFGFFVSRACRAGIDAAGLDTSKKATIYGQNQLGLKNLFCTSLAEHAAMNKSYKVATAFNFLEHVNVESIIDMYKLVEPSGYVLLRIPNASFHRFFHRVLCAFGLEHKIPHSVLATKPPSHLYGFSRKNLNILLENVGFIEIQICPSPLSDSLNRFNYRNLVSFISRFVYIVSSKKISISPTIYIIAKKPA